jgi:hypothetical protein
MLHVFITRTLVNVHKHLSYVHIQQVSAKLSRPEIGLSPYGFKFCISHSTKGILVTNLRWYIIGLCSDSDDLSVMTASGANVYY